MHVQTLFTFRRLKLNNKPISQSTFKQKFHTSYCYHIKGLGKLIKPYQRTGQHYKSQYYKTTLNSLFIYGRNLPVFQRLYVSSVKLLFFTFRKYLCSLLHCPCGQFSWCMILFNISVYN